MIKQPQLWDALQHPRDISSDTVAEMEATVVKYPYFQLLRTLIAKAKHDQQTPDAYAALGTAAVYAPDRRRLRQVFYDEYTLEALATEAPPSATNDTVTAEEEPAPPVPESASEPAGEVSGVSEPVRMEPPEEEPEAEARPDDVSASEGTAERKETSSALAEEPAEEDEASALREELTQTLQILEGSKEQLPDSIDVKAEDRGAPPDESTETAHSSLLDQPEPSAPSPSRSGASMQQDIIDRFVRANPSISRDPTLEPKNDTDLSARSTELQEGLVTENLAEIMLKQGKTDKAIDIYQKLILKYPDKKTYFAQKIDQLTHP